MELADGLAMRLEALYEGAERPEEVELAYIIKGRNNIVNKMAELIGSANDGSFLMTSNDWVLRRVGRALVSARRRGIRINIAADVGDEAVPEGVEVNKRLTCDCCILIVDMRTLFSVSNWTEGNAYAMMTQDKSLITMCREYYENPKCCCNLE
ncbi:MAG: TrmB family transcriptional regulator sugar-binding domain-containing protein [Candidatus Bathyarchaeia archaeon]